jgi:L-threonylcarbamoyladenylate synthase
MKLAQNIWDEENLVCLLKAGGIAVMPTDTIYGVVGKAEDRQVVERIYKIRKRNPEKPCIILIGDMGDLEKFSIILSAPARVVLAGAKEPTSFVLDCPDEKFAYLHRGAKTLAFRIPMQLELQNLLKQTGPLIAPSANPEGLPPAENISEAKKYFGVEVDMYIDGGEIKGKASKVIRLHKDGTFDIIRA